MNEIKKQTVLELSSVEKTLVFLVPPLLGLVIGWFLPVIAKWAVTLDWLPVIGPLEMIFFSRMEGCGCHRRYRLNRGNVADADCF
ncbi:hypothetical protein M5C89_21120 [Bacillus velezensis]|nr:hypothetical protein M5C89_21120 [Bacillus velezensis]